jgi:hypothetical protein
MQLQELKKLVEYEAVGTLMATSYGDGWVLIALKDDEQEKPASNDCALELARGGIRKFMTLDAVAKLVKSDLYNSTFTVC